MDAPAVSPEDRTDRLLYSMSSLYEMGDLIASEADIEEVAETALRGIMGAVAVSSGALLIDDAKDGCLRTSAVRGVKVGLSPVSIDASARSFLARKKRPILFEAGEWPSELNCCRESLMRLNPRVWIPLVFRNEVQGILSLGEKFLGVDYSEDDVQLLWTTGRHLSIGLYNQRLISEIRNATFQVNRKVVELETLYDAGLALGSSLQVKEVIEEVLLLSVGIVDARGGCLILKDEQTGRFGLEHSVGLTSEACEVMGETSFRRKIARMISSRKPLEPSSKDFSREPDFEFALAAPVGEVGGIVVVDKETHEGIQAFTEADAHLLELMGQQAGAAIANARLYKSMVEVKNYQQNVLTSIGNGVISTDLKGRIVQVNPSVRRIFGIEESLRGKSCARFFQRSGCREIAQAVAASLKDGEDRTVVGENVQEREIALDASITSLRNEQDEVQGLVIALEDLSRETRMRTMFKQYASDQVVDLLLADNNRPVLGGEIRDVTILFVDVRGSTALLSRIGPEEMVLLLNECFSRLNEIIFGYNGTFDKYTGDGFMVVYGAPVAFPDDSERAVMSALAMHQEMERFNRDRGDALGLGYGITRGKVLAGNIGSIRRMEYTVIGPAVGLSARLCDAARGGEIWTGPEIHAELKDRFDFESRGIQRFKGLDPTHVYEVFGPRGTRRRPTRKGGGKMVERRSKAEPKIDLTIPMIPDMELAASKTAEGVGEFMGLDQNKVEEVKMALIEACINAFEHSQSKDRRVFLDFDVGNDALTIRISDRGQGFDPERAQEIAIERRERHESRRGWGLKIIEELMDEVDIKSDENGTVITMVKRH